jgi:hypothetical protein
LHTIIDLKIKKSSFYNFCSWVKILISKYCKVSLKLAQIQYVQNKLFLPSCAYVNMATRKVKQISGPDGDCWLSLDCLTAGNLLGAKSPYIHTLLSQSMPPQTFRTFTIGRVYPACFSLALAFLIIFVS